MEAGASDEFAAGFPYEETEDQQSAIDATLEDLANGRPMDRLICGDVGFGKTEVALRAAFAAVMGGKQVAVVCRPRCWRVNTARPSPSGSRASRVNVGQASRLVSSAELTRVKKASPTAQSTSWSARTPCSEGDQVQGPRLVIVDEEQHFGVAHKERLKSLRARSTC